MKKTMVYSAISALLFSHAALAGDQLTRDNGAPVGDNQNSQTAGPWGGVLLQDVHLIEKLQRFDRERTPERVVHARGTGAHGEFIATKDFSKFTQADFLSRPGIKTPVFVRFSSVVHPTGSPETLRDPRGFATKFYTDQGNWDLVGINLPIFFIRDAIKFPDMVHSLKPSPVTNIQDPNRYFDFFSHVPESSHMLTRVYSDLGTPANYRQMDGFGVHSYKFVSPENKVNYVKFHWKSQQGIQSLDSRQVAEVQAKDFNHMTRDLYDNINAGTYPKWDLYIKVINPENLNKFDYNPLDATKVWKNIPEQKVGTMTLNRVPDNFFQATEQSAFAPSHLVPGIEPSEDRLLQGRVFSYADTQFHRLGANHQQLPINRPLVQVNNHNQNGSQNAANDTRDVNYQPSRYSEGLAEKAQFEYSSSKLSGTTQQKKIYKEQNFSQAGDFYRALDKQQQKNLIANMAGDLSQVGNAEIKQTIVGFMYKADQNYGKQLAAAVGVELKQAKAKARQFSEK